MKTNKKISYPVKRVAGGLGAQASRIGNVQALKRAVLTNFLWEDCAYEDGRSVAESIKDLVAKNDPQDVFDIAVNARNGQKLRHVPLMLAREMARLDTHKGLVSDLLYEVIQRPDELTEFLSLYFSPKKVPIANKVKQGLARAFTKFNAYSLAKYNRQEKIKLKDVLFLTHAKPLDEEQALVWKKLINGELESPDTWEVELSAGKGENKKESWERLLSENKLGALALLRNLRNMMESGVSDPLIRDGLKNCNPEKVLPFRFITAAKYAPKFEPELEALMFKSLSNFPKFKGKTCLLIDVSGSMAAKLSEKSELSRLDSAIALTILARELCEEIVIYCTAGSDAKRTHQTAIIKARRGFALVEEVNKAKNILGGGGIFTRQAVEYVGTLEKQAERVIVFSDSQDTDYSNKADSTNVWAKNNYLIDVSAHKNGVGYSKFHVINGFSENVLTYIFEYELLNELVNQ